MFAMIPLIVLTELYRTEPFRSGRLTDWATSTALLWSGRQAMERLMLPHGVEQRDCVGVERATNEPSQAITTKVARDLSDKRFDTEIMNFPKTS